MCNHEHTSDTVPYKPRKPNSSVIVDRRRNERMQAVRRFVYDSDASDGYDDARKRLKASLDNTLKPPVDVSPSGSKVSLESTSKDSRCTSASEKRSALRNSASLGKLSLAGAKKRLGFVKQKSLNVQRSEEVLPSDVLRFVLRDRLSDFGDSLGTSESFGDDSNSSISPGGLVMSFDSRSNNCFQTSLTDLRHRFVEGFGGGQLASRQALVSPYMGDIELSLSDTRDMLEVEIIQARKLQLYRGANKVSCK